MSCLECFPDSETIGARQISGQFNERKEQKTGRVHPHKYRRLPKWLEFDLRLILLVGPPENIYSGNSSDVVAAVHW